MEAVGTIEIRAGVDPTPGHIVELEERMRREGVKLVVRELHYPAGLAADDRPAHGGEAGRAAGHGGRGPRSARTT